MSGIIPALQMGKLSLGEVEQLPWGHTDLSLRARIQAQCQRKCALEVQHEQLQKRLATAHCYECLLAEPTGKTDPLSLSYSTVFFILFCKLQLGLSNAYNRICRLLHLSGPWLFTIITRRSSSNRNSGETTYSNKILCGGPMHKIECFPVSGHLVFWN